MSQSPWGATSREVPDRPSKPANWGFFLLISLGIGIGVGVLVAVLQASTGVALPDIVVNLFVLAVTVTWAGDRYLKSNGWYWTRTDRHRVAMAYTWVNAVVTVVVLGLAGAALFAGYEGDLGLPPEALTLGLPILLGVIAVVLPLALWANYGLNRLILFHFVNGKARARPRDVSDTFN